MFGTNGHHYNAAIANEDLRDKRVKQEHIHDCTNIRLRNSKRVKPIKQNRSMKGTSYSISRQCRKCRQKKHKKHFYDNTVMTKDRKHNSLNIICRDCQPIKLNKELKVKSIISHILKEDGHEFKVHWKGYTEDDDTYEPAGILQHLEIFKKYLLTHKLNKHPLLKHIFKKKINTNPSKYDNTYNEVESISEHCIKNSKFQFNVKWIGFSHTEDTWQESIELKNLDVFKKYIKVNKISENPLLY